MSSTLQPPISSFFFFNDTATTEIYTLSLHDALPILGALVREATARQRRLQRVDPDLVQANLPHRATLRERGRHGRDARRDRKSTRLNSSHQIISYAVFCLKKKNTLHPAAHRPSNVLR